MPRVLQVVTTTQRRGAEVFATDLGAALAARDWDVATVALERSGPPEGRLDVPALGSRRLTPASLAELRNRARDVDVVVAHGSTSLVACAAASTASRTPFVYRSVGDPGHWTPAGLRRLRSTVLLRQAAAVVVLWSAAAEILRARPGLGATRIAVIPNGVPASRCHVAAAEEQRAARAALRLPTEGAVVVSVGALSVEKRLDRSIRAVGEQADLHLAVVGDGPQRADLEALAQRCADGRVTFTGAVAEVGPVYAAADALVLASATEGMPAVLIEAGLSGRPAVATDVGAVSEVVIHGETGLLVHADGRGLATAVVAAVADRDRLGSAARRHCLERFELETVADRWHDLLDEVVRSS